MEPCNKLLNAYCVLEKMMDKANVLSLQMAYNCFPLNDCGEEMVIMLGSEETYRIQNARR